MNINIGELIKEEMDRQGITATQLAKKIYCERTNVINITHRNSINTELLMRICRALKVNYFSILADEMWKEGLPKPDDSNNNGQLAMVIDKKDMPYFKDKDISEGFEKIKVLDISLEINGVNFDESLEQPQEVFPLLIYAYSCALDGPLKNMDDEQLDDQDTDRDAEADQEPGSAGVGHRSWSLVSKVLDRSSESSHPATRDTKKRIRLKWKGRVAAPSAQM